MGDGRCIVVFVFDKMQDFVVYMVYHISRQTKNSQKPYILSASK